VSDFIMRRARRILEKRNGFYAVSDKYITLMPADFYRWVYSQGYLFLVKRKAWTVTNK
jgi:hypothetical protein